jgi:hypothetical protein
MTKKLKLGQQSSMIITQDIEYHHKIALTQSPSNTYYILHARHRVTDQINIPDRIRLYTADSTTQVYIRAN